MSSQTKESAKYIKMSSSSLTKKSFDVPLTLQFLPKLLYIFYLGLPYLFGAVPQNDLRAVSCT